jgi:hypothetical protein
MARTEERPSGEVAGEPVGVGEREGAEGGLPALHGGALDESVLSVASDEEGGGRWRR